MELVAIEDGNPPKAMRLNSPIPQPARANPPDATGPHSFHTGAPASALDDAHYLLR
jgi:hypothetical protein